MDANGCSASQNYGLNVGCPTILLSQNNLPDPTVRVGYSQPLTASAGVGPYRFTLGSGTLPGGLKLSTNGIISGTPTNTGAFNFTVMATDANGCVAGSNYVLNVDCATLTITSGSLPSGITTVKYNRTLTAAGGLAPYRYSISGTIPPGLNLVASNGVISGTPNQAGTYNFTVIATDVQNCAGGTNYTVVIKQAPVANSAQIQVLEDSANNPVTLTTYAPDSSVTNFSITAYPAHGTITPTKLASGASQLIYTPTKGYYGNDAIGFVVADNTVTSAVATVLIQVVNIYPLPVANNANVTVGENIATNFTVVAGDAYGSPLTYNIVSGPKHGVLSGFGPQFTYTPNTYYYGPDTITYNAQGPHGPSSNATVNLNIYFINQPPSVFGQNLQMNENTNLPIKLADLDVDGPRTNFLIVAYPAHGQLSGISNGTLIYTPALGYYGPDSFSYYASDGSLASTNANINIQVNYVAPTTFDINSLLNQGLANPPGGGYTINGLTSPLNSMILTGIGQVNGVWTATGGQAAFAGLAFDINQAIISNGKLTISGSLGLPFSDAQLSVDQLTVVKTGTQINLSFVNACAYNIPLKKINLESLCLSYNNVGFSGSTTFDFKMQGNTVKMGGGVGITTSPAFHLDYLNGNASGLHIPVADTGVIWDSFSGGAQFGAGGYTSFTLSGSAGFYYGNFTINGYRPVSMNLYGTINSDGSYAAQGDGYLFNIHVGSVYEECYPASGWARMSGYMNYYDILIGKFAIATQVSGSGFLINGNASVLLQVPSKGFGIFNGAQLGSAAVGFQVSPNDFIVSGSATVIGIKASFYIDNGNFNIGKNNVVKPSFISKFTTQRAVDAWATPFNPTVPVGDNGATLTMMNNWTLADKASTSKSGRPFTVSAVHPNYDSPDPATSLTATFTVPTNTAAVIFRLNYANTNATNVAMTMSIPSGTNLDVNAGFLPNGYTNVTGMVSMVQLDEGMAYFILSQPAPGDYTITVSDTNSLGAFTVDMLTQNPSPTVAINSITPTMTNEVYDVNYTSLFDPSTSPTTSIYLGYGDATYTQMVGPSFLLNTNASVNGTNDFLIDTRNQNFGSGNYQVIVEVNDPASELVRAISTQLLSVANTNAPLPVSQIAAAAGNQSFTTAWTPSPDASVVSYMVYYTTGSQFWNYRSMTNVDAFGLNPTNVTIMGLTNGQPYLVAVASVNSNGVQSVLSDVLRVVPSAGPGVTPPIIISQPPFNATATADHELIYAVQTFDGDEGALVYNTGAAIPALSVPVDANGLYWQLINAPDGMTISTNGVINWTPTDDQVGTNNFVTIRATKMYSAFGLAPTNPPLVAEQSFNINVFSNYLPPAPNYAFLSRPVTSVNEGLIYKYTPQAFVSNPAFSITVMQGPVGMSVNTDTNGVDSVVWNAPLGADGQEVILRAAPRNATVTAGDYVYQDYFLAVTSTNNQLPAANAPLAGTNPVQHVDLNQTITIPVTMLLSNAIAAPGVNLQMTSVTSGTNDTVTLSGANIIYTPTTGYSGLDSFTYVFTDGINLVTGVVNLAVNQLPIANPDSFNRTAGLNLRIKISDLLTNDTDTAGDPLALAGISLAGINLVTTNGANLLTNDTYIVYTNSANVNDQFSYSISDGYHSAVGLVSIVVVNSIAGQFTGNIVIDSNHQVTMSFAGIPGDSYSVQRSTNLTDWITVWTTNAPDSGLFHYTDNFNDLNGTAPQSAYYRLSWNP